MEKTEEKYHPVSDDGRELPHNDDLERCVLGTLMVDCNALYFTIGSIHREMFLDRRHQLVFDAIRNLYENSRAVDLLTVTEELCREGNMDEAGGEAYVSPLVSGVISGAHIETHIAILTELYVRREAIAAATELIDGAYSGEIDPFKLLDTTGSRLMGICENLPGQEDVSMDKAVPETLEAIGLDSYDEGYLGVPSGFAGLDRMTDGFRPGTLTILASRPAVGKTSLAISIARFMAVECRMPVAFFSLDIGRKNLVSRFISQELDMDRFDLRRAGSLPVERRKKVFDRMRKLGAVPIHIDDSDGVDILRLRAKCRRMILKYGIRAVFVDDLQSISVPSGRESHLNREQTVGYIAHQLKELSRELNIPVIATAHLSRRVERRPKGIPSLADLRESGILEQEADTVVGIHRPWLYGITEDEYGESTEDRATLYVMKNNCGGTGAVSLHFDGKSTRFSNLPLGFSDPRVEAYRKMMSSASRPAAETGNNKGKSHPEDDDDLPF